MHHKIIRWFVLTLILLAFGSSMLFAAPVIRSMVDQVGQTKLLATNTVTKRSFLKKGGVDYQPRTVSGIREIKDQEKGNILAYVLDLDPKGFIVISSDTDIIPVIAHSFESNFVMDESSRNVLLNIVTWDMQNRLEALPITSVEIKEDNNELWNKYIYADYSFLTKLTSQDYPPPLLATAWHQSEPYNNYCPLDTWNDQTSDVGCVATAMAQIINYHQHPSTVVFADSDSYWTTRCGYIYAPSADIYHIPYGIPDLAGPLLSYSCGVSVKMEYSSENSSAMTADVAAALKQYFGYTSGKWVRINYGVYRNLRSNSRDGMPAQLSLGGTDPITKGPIGHSVVVDGYYPITSEYHLNVGWSSVSYNIWYALPEKMPYPLSFVKGAVVDIHPTTVPPSPAQDHLAIDSGDYNGDGVSDVAIFRPGTGLWSVRGLTRIYFGSEDDIPVPGDYSGNGTTDFAVFRQSSGLWAVQAGARQYFGGAIDWPVPGDYNGDGSCDLGVFREIIGLWAIKNVTRAYFGRLGDVPIPGDYNGNGKKDIALYRPATGLWVLKGISRMYFGTNIDRISTGDYTGDGIWEPGIFRPTTGLWAIKGVTRTYYGTESDIPLNTDLNGDAKSDIALYRPHSGLWAINGVARYYYGSALDYPVTGPPCKNSAPSSSGKLPKTGQTISYRTGDDGYYKKGLARSYTNNGNGTVTDNVTGLMWARDGNGAGCNYGNALTWNAAITWAGGLTFAGYSDWRLPNRNELRSIADYGRCNPAINTTYFPNTVSGNYWSGSIYAGDTSGAWYIGSNGGVHFLNKDYTCYVRVVRGGE